LRAQISTAVRKNDFELLQFLNSSIEFLQSTGKIKGFEKAVDANWLHIKREWEFN